MLKLTKPAYHNGSAYSLTNKLAVKDHLTGEFDARLAGWTFLDDDSKLPRIDIKNMPRT